VAQGEDPEFKPQYCKKGKEKVYYQWKISIIKYLNPYFK
jgi:hypothetical protein